MATAGTVVLEAKIAVDIILAEDGKYYVDSATTMDGVIVRGWTEGPFETEAKARDCVEWQYSIPMLEKLAQPQGPVAVLNLLDQSDGSPKGPRTQQSVNVYPAAAEVGLGAVPSGRGREAATR
jgi:hypothetical protein